MSVVSGVEIRFCAMLLGETKLTKCFDTDTSVISWRFGQKQQVLPE